MTKVKQVSGEALQTVCENFENAYRKSRQEETNEFRRILKLEWHPKEGRDSEEYEFRISIPIGYYKIRCLANRVKQLCGLITCKTDVWMTRHRIRSNGFETCDENHGPMHNKYELDETAFRYLMYYGTFGDYEIHELDLIMPHKLHTVSIEGLRLLSSETIKMTNNERTRNENLVESWLKAIDFNKLKNLTMHTQHCSFIINSNDIEKLKTVENLKIVGKANIGTEFLEKFEGVEFEHKKYEGSSSLNFRRSLAIFVATHNPPAQLRNRSFSFNMKHDMNKWEPMSVAISENLKQGVYNHIASQPKESYTFTRIENKIKFVLKMTANNLTITISGEDTNN